MFQESYKNLKKILRELKLLFVEKLEGYLIL